MRTLACLLLVLLPALAGAGTIYRHVDANGQVVFTDQPAEGAAAVSLPPVNQVPADAIRGLPPPAPAAAAFAGYRTLEVVGVPADGILQNPQAGVPISAEPDPELQEGHRLLLYRNGELVAEGGTFEWPQPERGSHTFSAEILDAEGNVLIRSADLVVHVQRPMVRKKKK